MKKTLISALITASIGLFSASPSIAAEKQNTSQKALAMQCYAIYDLLMVDDSDPESEYRNPILTSQSIMMVSIYAAYMQKEGRQLSEDDFADVLEFSRSALLAKAQTNRQAFVKDIVKCEGWREHFMTFILTEASKIGRGGSSVASEIFTNLPEPRDDYKIDGSALMQLNLIADKAVLRALDRTNSKITAQSLGQE